ncbi:TniQ family protein [Deinococcus aquiradiocola]|uniref:TniQ domain-containing protein n=1 Tax=Deinococcus aquiradiocola TaxID=393059 RepID=A0A917UNX2_9DEIO|nr:TniQ family protein [Deinococcus aquiradiocola]GGJ71286.1 hypothetical protein GCM10008939_14580 [Deinococcus aquiradiocola]
MIQELVPILSRTRPIPGEALSSYLDRLSAHMPLAVPLTALYYRLGLQESERAADVPSAIGITLTPRQLKDAAHVLRLPEVDIRRMLLSHYDGVAVNLTGLDPEDSQSLRRTGMREWAYMVGSHYCPACLAEDQAWRVAWKLPFSFACERHQALLNDTCPLCARRSGNVREDLGGASSYATKKRTPGFCMNPPATGVADQGRNAEPCGQNLGAVPQLDLADSLRLLGTQRHLNGVMEAGVDARSGLPALAYFQALRSLCALMLYVAEPADLGELPETVLKVFADRAEERNLRLDQRREKRAEGKVFGGPAIHTYGAVPTSAGLMAAMLPQAVEILTPSVSGSLDAQELSEKLFPFIQRLRDREQNKLRLVSKNFKFTGALLQGFNRTLDDQSGFNHRLGLRSRHAHSKAGYAFTAHHVPQLLWENEYRTNFAPLFQETDMMESTLRRVCSAALVRLGGQTDWQGACSALEFPTTFATGACNKAMGVLNNLQNGEAFARALHDLAARLGALPSKANFHARRFELREFVTMRSADWDDLVFETSARPTKNTGKRRHAAVFIWEQVTGGDFRLAPALRGMSPGPARDMYIRFLKQDLGTLGPALMDRAHQLAAFLDAGHPELMLDFPK